MYGPFFNVSIFDFEQVFPHGVKTIIFSFDKGLVQLFFQFSVLPEKDCEKPSQNIQKNFKEN